jgi:hypothetical protein
VPQVLNALRFEFDMTPYPQLMHIYEQAITHPAFADAMPRNA